MRLVFYNMRYGSGTGVAYHLPFPMAGFLRPAGKNMARITEFLRAANPDIIGLVEVDNGSFLRSRKQCQADRIARELGHFHSYCSKYEPGSLAGRLPMMSRQGNAILARDTIHAVKPHYFRVGVKRLVLEAELPALSLFVVHLSLKQRDRAEQLRHLHKIVCEVRKPVIVAGDFNTFSGERELDEFTQATGLRNASRHGHPSWPAHAPRHQLDFILHSPQVRVRHFEIPDIHLSDHRPLLCDFDIGK
jgi:endonuclease/exonuclease/phosphatase family metal-dependent hydrolase